MDGPIKLRDYEMEIIRQAGVTKHYHPGESIFCIGDPADRVYLIESGWVKFSRNPKVSHIRHSGALLGVIETAQGLNRTWNASAISKVKLVVIEWAAFMELLDCEPFLTVKIAKLLAHQVV